MEPRLVVQCASRLHGIPPLFSDRLFQANSCPHPCQPCFRQRHSPHHCPHNPLSRPPRYLPAHGTWSRWPHHRADRVLWLRPVALPVWFGEDDAREVGRTAFQARPAHWRNRHRWRRDLWRRIWLPPGSGERRREALHSVTRWWEQGQRRKIFWYISAGDSPGRAMDATRAEGRARFGPNTRFSSFLKLSARYEPSRLNILKFHDASSFTQVPGHFATACIELLSCCLTIDWLSASSSGCHRTVQKKFLEHMVDKHYLWNIVV